MAAGLLVIAVAAPARAQGEKPSPSLNLALGSVGSTSESLSGSLAALSIGTDIPLTRRWGLRLEAGQRLPRHRQSREQMTVYLYRPDPQAPEFLRAFPVQRTTEIDETALGDLSLFARFNSPPGDSRFEVAVLGGVGVNWVDVERMTAQPHSLDNLDDIDVRREETMEARPIFAAGMEAGRSFGDRWSVLLHGIIGYQSPWSNDRRVQPRAGIMLKRVF